MNTGTVTLVCVHGATSGPWVFDAWDDVPVWDVVAVDLHRGLTVASASMADYAATVASATRRSRRPVVVCGWSMGGLVALMAADEVPPDALVVVEPSPPAEVQGGDPSIVPMPGTYGFEDAYGPLPPGIRHRSESLLARDERRRGISVPRIACPALVVHGEEFARTRGRDIVQRYGVDGLAFDGLDHIGLVADPQVRRAIASWLAEVLR